MEGGTECQKWGKYNFNAITIANSSEYLLNGHKAHIWTYSSWPTLAEKLRQGELSRAMENYAGDIFEKRNKSIFDGVWPSKH